MELLALSLETARDLDVEGPGAPWWIERTGDEGSEESESIVLRRDKDVEG